MNILLLHPVASWSLDRVAVVCEREDWQLTIVTIESSTVGDKAATLREWIRVPALSDDPRELLGQIGERRFDAVVAGNEFAVIAADVLARELGLFHNDVDKIRASRNKALMRSVFEEYGVPQPKVVARLDSAADRAGIDWDAVAFPVIVKPVDMAMSLFVRKCDSRAEVEDTLERMSAFKLSRLTNYVFDTGALIEEFVDGPEYSLECVVQGGEVVECALTQKFNSPLPACYETGHVSGAEIPPQHRRPLLDAVARIARSWGLSRGVMHVEFKMTDERLSIIEAAARPAGGHVPEIVELQHGLSLEEAFLFARLGRDRPVAPRGPSGVRHGIRFHFEERSAAERPQSVEVVKVVHDDDGVVPGAEPFSVNRRTGYSILRSESPEDLDRYIRVL